MLDCDYTIIEFLQVTIPITLFYIIGGFVAYKISKHITKG